MLWSGVGPYDYLQKWIWGVLPPRRQELVGCLEGMAVAYWVPGSPGECSSWLIGHVTQEATGLWDPACPQCSRVQGAGWAPSRFPRHGHPCRWPGERMG